MEEIIFDASRHEFGNSLSCGLLIPYIFKRTGKYRVIVYSKIDLEKEITDIICDEYILKEPGKINEKAIETKNDIGKFLNQKINENIVTVDHILSIPYSCKKRLIEDNYIVVIPTVWENLNFKECNWRINHSLNKQTWIDIKNFANNKGYKVVGFGTDQSCIKEEMLEFCDISFWNNEYSDLIRPINKFVKTQLEWLYFAKTSVSVGGAFHISMCFTVPGIGWDGQIEKDYNNFSKILSFKRKDLHYIPCLGYGKAFLNLENKIENHKQIQKHLKDLILTKLKNIL